jgi:2-hydroxy-3-oxopropionate reductase
MAEIVGVIGLGLMGKPMARNLLKAKYRVIVHSRSRGPVDELAADGAEAGSTPADVARQATVIITIVPDTPDVRQVLTGPQGVLTALRPGSLVIDMSTISPVATRQLAAAVAERGSRMLDAPVSGGEIGAINGSLSIMVGGDAGAFERARPVLGAMGRPLYIGESGAGQLCKTCNQVVIAGALAGVVEAFALATKAGVDVARVREALLGGFAGSRVLDVHGERILTRNYVPGFKSRLYMKDLRIAKEVADANGLAAPATAVVAELLDALVRSGGGDLDYAAIAKVAFQRAGIIEDRESSG